MDWLSGRGIWNQKEPCEKIMQDGGFQMDLFSSEESREAELWKDTTEAREQNTIKREKIMMKRRMN